MASFFRQSKVLINEGEQMQHEQEITRPSWRIKPKEKKDSKLRDELTDMFKESLVVTGDVIDLIVDIFEVSQKKPEEKPKNILPQTEVDALLSDPKEPEMMTFSNARRKANNGDILKLSIPGPSEGFFITEITVGQKGNFDLTWKQYDSDQWQIIPAEPKVLTTEEIIEKNLKEYNTRPDYYSEALSILSIARDNYRLERDLEVRPLTKAIENAIHVMGDNTGDFGSAIGLVSQELKNIKPLKEK